MTKTNKNQKNKRAHKTFSTVQYTDLSSYATFTISIVNVFDIICITTFIDENAGAIEIY